LEYFEPLALKKKILIKCDIESFKFTINKDDFIRVFNNLISNAIKYNKVGGEIHIILKEKNLVVSDTGIGISNEKINNIFERYYRATSEQGGFGIGLNIVNRICRKYNINITVDSKIKNGTSFTLYFK
jgi:two-component system OmpR family sensor kinase